VSHTNLSDGAYAGGEAWQPRLSLQARWRFLVLLFPCGVRWPSLRVPDC
jgi:hypothetical protein